MERLAAEQKLNTDSSMERLAAEQQLNNDSSMERLAAEKGFTDGEVLIRRGIDGAIGASARER